jgi:hypothetical protein
MTTYNQSKEVKFSDKLNWHFARTRLSQVDFANLVGVTPPAVRHWLEGTNFPKEAQLLPIIEVLLKYGGFEEGKELEEAMVLWKLHSTHSPFNKDWFKKLLEQSKNGVEEENIFDKDAVNSDTKSDNSGEGNNEGSGVTSNKFGAEHGLMVKPKGEGDVIRLKDFQQHKIVLAGQFDTFFAVRLTDAVTIMGRVCRNYDAECEQVVVKPSSLYESYFKLEYRSKHFVVTLERDWDSGIRMILTTENLSQLTVTITIKASEEVAGKLLEDFKRQPGVQNIKILREW